MKFALLSILMSFVWMYSSFAQSSQKSVSSEETSIVIPQEFSESNKWDYFLYPVPAVDEINVKITKGYVTIQQINIIDELGNDVMEMRELSGDKIKVDISELKEGKYFMQIIPNDKMSVKMKRFYVAN